MNKTLGLLFFLFISLNTHAQQDPKARGILDAMSNKYKAIKSFSAAFTYSAVSPSGKTGRVSSGKITAKGVKFKLHMAGQEIYNNGQEIYTYVKETNEVNITEYDSSEESPFSPSNIYNIYKKGYNYKFVKETKLGGKSIQLIELTPQKAENIKKVLIGVNKTNKQIENWKIWDSSGKATVFTITSFKSNAPAADALFSFNTAKHPGVEVVDLR